MLLGRTRTPLRELQHPEYGTVLVGGGTKFSSRIPPSFMMEEELHRNFAFTMYHADQMPLLRFESVEAKSLPGGLWEVTASVANDRLIPTRTVRAATAGIGIDDVLVLQGADVVSSGTLAKRRDRAMEPQWFRPAELRFPRGVPGQGSVHARFLVKAAAGTAITLRWTSQKAKAIESTVRLGEQALPAAVAK